MFESPNVEVVISSHLPGREPSIWSSAASPTPLSSVPLAGSSRHELAAELCPLWGTPEHIPPGTRVRRPLRLCKAAQLGDGILVITLLGSATLKSIDQLSAMSPPSGRRLTLPRPPVRSKSKPSHLQSLQDTTSPSVIRTSGSATRNIARWRQADTLRFEDLVRWCAVFEETSRSNCNMLLRASRAADNQRGQQGGKMQ